MKSKFAVYVITITTSKHGKTVAEGVLCDGEKFSPANMIGVGAMRHIRERIAARKNSNGAMRNIFKQLPKG